MQADHHSAGPQQVEHARLDHQAAAAGHHRSPCRMAVLDELPFPGAKRRLALVGEDLRHRPVLQPFDLVVAVQRLETEAVRHGAPDRRLPVPIKPTR